MPSSANNNYYYYNNFIYVALISWAHGALQCKKGENEIIYKNNDSLSKNCLKSYVFDPFSKRVKGGDLSKSNGSEFHSLGAHTEKAFSQDVFVNDRFCSNSCFDANCKFRNVIDNRSLSVRKVI